MANRSLAAQHAGEDSTEAVEGLFSACDELRGRLQAAGIKVMDTRSGQG